MSFTFRKDAADDKKYVSKAGVYEAIVTSAKMDYLPPRTDLYTRITFQTTEGEFVIGDLFAKADKNGGHERLEQFIAATANDAEIEEYLQSGEINPDETFLQTINQRAIGRKLKVVVTERKYQKKDGTEGVAYQASYFRRLTGSQNPY